VYSSLALVRGGSWASQVSSPLTPVLSHCAPVSIAQCPQVFHQSTSAWSVTVPLSAWFSIKYSSNIHSYYMASPSESVNLNFNNICFLDNYIYRFLHSLFLKIEPHILSALLSDTPSLFFFFILIQILCFRRIR
jgi:hypothetical protein